MRTHKIASQKVTSLLQAWRDGDVEALRALMPLVYSELRKIAHYHFARERAGHTLQPTEVVNEVYLRLAEQRVPMWQDRSQLLAFCAKLMRWILVDHARRRAAAKRGGQVVTVSLADGAAEVPAATTSIDLLALEDAMTRLEQLEPRQSQIVELKYFAGLTIEETARVMEISPSLVKKDWRMARAWLFQQLAAARTQRATDAQAGHDQSRAR